MSKCCQSVTNFVFRHGCSPVNLLYILRALFSKNTSGGLLLTQCTVTSDQYTYYLGKYQDKEVKTESQLFRCSSQVSSFLLSFNALGNSISTESKSNAYLNY